MNKEYKAPARSVMERNSRISIEDQAKSYAAIVQKTGVKTLTIYPLKKRSDAGSNTFRQYLFCHLLGLKLWLFSDSELVKKAIMAGYQINEVDPKDFL